MVFTRKYCTELTNLSMLSVFEVEIWCYRGGNIVPKWINRQDGKRIALGLVRFAYRCKLTRKLLYIMHCTSQFIDAHRDC
jgi:hypothetical protein